MSQPETPGPKLEATVTPQVIEQSAILKLLHISTQVIAEESKEITDLSEPLNSLLRTYRDYHRIQDNFIATSPVLEERNDDDHRNLSEADLKMLFSSDEYEEFKGHANGVETTFQRLKESLQFEDIKAKWFNQDLHLKNKPLKLKSPEAITYSHALSSMPNLKFSLEKDQDLKFLENIREAVETFTYNLDRSSSEYTDFKELATKLRIINPNLVKERLGTINRDLKAMARLILGRQLHPRPNLKKQTYAVAWELSESRGISDDEIQPTHEAREPPIFPNYIQKYEILVELRSIDNTKQEEVQRTDFGPSGKYRGICKLYIKCAAENFPGETFWFGASGWLIDNRTVVTCGHCVYHTIRSREKLNNYGILRAVDIRAYIGYCKGTVADSNCMEMRRGIWALTHQEWYERQDMDCDIAMIRLEKPFDETKTFSYVDKTPKTVENETVYMVGYPADIPPHLQQVMPGSSAGEIMYESLREENWDLDNLHAGLKYRADTYAGTSGSPVLRRKDGNDIEVIGIHAGGDGQTGINSATTIGHFGNDLPTFLNALDTVQGTTFVNERLRPDKVERWPDVHVLTLPYITRS